MRRDWEHWEASCGAPSCAPHPLAHITYLLPNLLIAAAITLTGPTNRQPVNYQALKVALTAILKTPLLMVIPSLAKKGKQRGPSYTKAAEDSKMELDTTGRLQQQCRHAALACGANRG